MFNPPIFPKNFLFIFFSDHLLQTLYGADARGVDKGGGSGPRPPILQTKHLHTFKLY